MPHQEGSGFGAASGWLFASPVPLWKEQLWYCKLHRERAASHAKLLTLCCHECSAVAQYLSNHEEHACVRSRSITGQFETQSGGIASYRLQQPDGLIGTESGLPHCKIL